MATSNDVDGRIGDERKSIDHRYVDAMGPCVPLIITDMDLHGPLALFLRIIARVKHTSNQPSAGQSSEGGAVSNLVHWIGGLPEDRVVGSQRSIAVITVAGFSADCRIHNYGQADHSKERLSEKMPSVHFDFPLTLGAPKCEQERIGEFDFQNDRLLNIFQVSCFPLDLGVQTVTLDRLGSGDAIAVDIEHLDDNLTVVRLGINVQFVSLETKRPGQDVATVKRWVRPYRTYLLRAGSNIQWQGPSQMASVVQLSINFQ